MLLGLVSLGNAPEFPIPCECTQSFIPNTCTRLDVPQYASTMPAPQFSFLVNAPPWMHPNFPSPVNTIKFYALNECTPPKCPPAYYSW